MSEGINSKLYDEAKAGDEALVSQLIEQGAEVDWTRGSITKTIS